MNINGNAPRRGNVGQLGGKASLMAASIPMTASRPAATAKEIKQHIRKLGICDKQKLQECLSLAEGLQQENPSWEPQRLAEKLVELSSLKTP